MAFVQYKTVVDWDADLRDVGFADAQYPITGGLAVSALKITAGIPAAIAGHWLPGALVQNIVDGSVWQNNGTTAAPAWYLV